MAAPGFGYGNDKIFIINSYHRGKVLSDKTIEVIVSEMSKNRDDLTFYIEDMDTKRHSLDSVTPSILSCYSMKYAKVDFSAVVTVDNNALKFALENREKLFPGVPIVFCGVNGYQPEMLEGFEQVTGVAEAIDLDSTVKLALALHPRTTHLAVVSDTTTSGREVLTEFRSYAKRLPETLQIVELSGLSAPMLSARLSALPERTIVLRLSFFRDSTGRNFNVQEQADLISSAGLPVYDFWDESIGMGYVGGYLVTGFSQGQAVSSMLMRILEGEPVKNIPVIDKSPNVPVFDSRELVKTGADLSQLPANAILRYQEVPFWTRYPKLVVGAAVAFLAIVGVAIFFALLSRQRSQHALALSCEKRKLNATLQSIGEAVVATNSSGEIEQLNSVSEEWMGITEEQARGLSIGSIFNFTDNSSGTPVDWNFNETCSGSGWLSPANGKRIPIALTAAPIELEQGDRSGIVVVFRNMTRENELQNELAEVRRLDSLGQLAGGVAHDFNNVLGGIVGAAELLNQSLKDDEALNEFPRLIIDSAKGAADLTSQLLSFARKRPFTRKDLSINDLVDNTIAVLKRTIDPRVKIDNQTNAENDVIKGDNSLLQSCLLNLGINASHAMPTGGRLVFSTRVIHPPKRNGGGAGWIEILVSDTGTGMPPEVIDRIFEPFFTTKEEGKGTGLGLAAVFGTMKQHGGNVEVTSKMGLGTTFTLKLPLVDSSVTLKREVKETAVKGSGLILVVDDMKPLRVVATKTLEVLGYEVLAVSDGFEAVELFKRERDRIDVVLLDMIMPRMNGRDCLVELRRIDPDVCVVGASGFFSTEDLQELQDLGMHSYINKPYSRIELSKALQNALEPDQELMLPA